MLLIKCIAHTYKYFFLQSSLIIIIIRVIRCIIMDILYKYPIFVNFVDYFKCTVYRIIPIALTLICPKTQSLVWLHFWLRILSVLIAF